MRGRLTAGLLNKAERGELALNLPAGLMRDAGGAVVKDPDREIQDRIALVFTSFLEQGSVAKVMRIFARGALGVPRRDRFGEAVWRPATLNRLNRILKNPGLCRGLRLWPDPLPPHAVSQRQTDDRTLSDGGVEDRCEGQIPGLHHWESFERIQAMLRDNHAEYDRNRTRGVPRDGAALLQGIVWCGQCGHKMAVQYRGSNRYICHYLHRSQGDPICQHLPADPIDARVVEAFFAAVTPAELEAWTRAQDARHQADEALDRAEAQQVERLRYQALLAERQFNRVDPDNRNVAGELEHRWELALRELRQAEDALARHRAERAAPETLSDGDRERFLTLGPRLPALWEEPEMTRERKKALLRSLIDKVVLRRAATDRISVRIVWRGGAVSELEVAVAVYTHRVLPRGAEMEARLLDLARQGVDDATIAAQLTAEGHRSARCGHVPVDTVRHIRESHRVLRDWRPTHPWHIPGWLTLAELARKLQVSRDWIERRIRNGRIAIVRDAETRRFLVPDTDETLARFEALKSGAVDHLDCTQSTN